MGYAHDYLYWALIVRWVDGDTVDVVIDLGFSITRKERLRLAGVNTPEMAPKHADFDTDADREAHIEKAKEAKAYCEYLAPAGAKVLVRTFKDKTGKFGRMLAHVIPDENEMATVNQMLVEQGLAEEIDAS